MPLDTQFGVKKETTYGTPVTVDRFFPFNHALGSIMVERGYIESNSMRAGGRVQSSTAGTPYTKGAAGAIELEVNNKGFGFWLEHMLGTVATAGPTDSAYTHTGTIGSLCGKGFTMQDNRPLGTCAETDQAFTFSGGKVAKWELSCQVEGFLIFKADLLFQDGTTATALASASYPSGLEVLSWAGASLTVDATALPVTSWKVTCDNKLKADRYYLQGSTDRGEPVENDLREIMVEFQADWTNLDLYDKWVAATAAGTLAAVEFTCESPTLIGTTSVASLTVTCPEARINGLSIDGSGREHLMQTITAKVLQPASGEAIEVAYVTSTSTP